jgi:hypothetical protein
MPSFLKFYHQHLPVVEFGQIEKLDTLVLWTVILISSQHHPELSSLFLPLREAHMKLFQKAVFADVYTDGTVQSLLLLCTWPLPVMKQVWDPSWRYCNLALAASQQLGLHKPDSQWEYFVTPGPVDASVQIWAACISVATTLSLDLGFPCPVDTLSPNLSEQKLGKTLSTHFGIQKHVLYHVQTTASKNPFFSGAAIRESMRDLEEMRTQKGASWPAHTRLEYLAARLKIYLHHLQFEPSSDDQRYLIKQSWYSTLEVSLQLSDQLSSMINPNTTNYPEYTNTDSDSGLAIHALPKHYFYIFMLSAFAILKFLALQKTGTDIDREKARNGIRSFYDSFQKLSKMPDDEFSRIARVINFLARAERDHLLEIKTTAKTRSSASLVTDTIRARDMLRERNSGLSRSETDLSATPDEHIDGSPIFPSTTLGISGLEWWNDNLFDFIQAEASSTDWTGELWFHGASGVC